jgi:hypothetical protein
LMICGSQVIKENGEIALTWVKMHVYDLCITNLQCAVGGIKVRRVFYCHLSPQLTSFVGFGSSLGGD